MFTSTVAMWLPSKRVSGRHHLRFKQPPPQVDGAGSVKSDPIALALAPPRNRREDLQLVGVEKMSGWRGGRHFGRSRLDGKGG